MTRPATSPGDVLLGRYELVDRAGGSDDAQLWRAHDSRLGRSVLVLVLDETDERVAQIRADAEAAAKFADRRAAVLLDVSLVKDVGLVVVSEWEPAPGFGEFLRSAAPDGLPPAQAAAVAADVASLIAAAHRVGVTHGRLRPDSVVVTETGEIRVRGLGMQVPDAPIGEATRRALDIGGIGALFYAGLTGRWPGTAADGLPEVPALSTGALPWPSRVRADIPADYDHVAARAVNGAALPKGVGRFTSAGELEAALRPLAGTGAPPPATDTPRRTGRIVGVIAASALVIALVAVGISMASGPLTKPAPVARNTGTVGLGLDSSDAPTVIRPAGRDVPVVAVYPLDPDELAKSRTSVDAVIDGDPTTAWRTRPVATSSLPPASGTGVVLDLGAPRPISSVSLVLVGNGTDLSVLAGSTGSARGDLRVTARRRGAPTTLTIRLPVPRTTRYVGIWLTGFPPGRGGYRGGIAEVSVRS